MRSLIPWRRHTERALSALEEGMEGLFGRFFNPPLVAFEEKELRTWRPRVDVEETEKELLVKADVPGVDLKDVEVTLVDGVLVLRGEKKEEREEKEKNYHRVERFVGEFYREIPLPPGADPEKIEAKGAKGVLVITIPKKPEVMPKKIAVKSEE